MNRRHEPLDPEERALARLLADADAAEPSAAVDARILAAARAALPAHAGTAAPPTGATGGTRHRRPRRLPLALGLAASVTLAVGVAWQLREPPVAPGQARVAMEAADVARTPATPPAAPRPEAQEHGAAVAAASRRAEQRVQKAERQLEQAAAPPPPVADAGISLEEAAPERRREAPTDAAAGAAREREHEAAVAAAAQRSVQRGEKAARQAEPAAFPAAAPSPPPPPPPPAPPAPPSPVSAPAPAAAASMARTTDDTRPADAYKARVHDSLQVSGTRSDPGGADRAALEADAALPPEQWLQRIRAHRDGGDADLARASLARFIHDHPAVPVPADLQPLLP